MKKVARIVSEDSRFARMLAIELLAAGIEITESFGGDNLGAVYYVIADLDTCSYDELLIFTKNSVLIGFSKESNDSVLEKSVICEDYLKRPFLIKDFLSLFGETGTNYRRLNTEFTVKNSTKNNISLSVSEVDKSAVWGDLLIPLSDNEYKVLSLLCKNRREVVERERIYAELGAEEGNMGDVYICHLRKKIDNKLGVKLIYTVRGKGYMLKN